MEVHEAVHEEMKCAQGCMGMHGEHGAVHEGARGCMEVHGYQQRG